VEVMMLLIAQVLVSQLLAVAYGQIRLESPAGTWYKLVVDERESDVFVPACAQNGSPMILSLHAWGTTKDLQENTVDMLSLPSYIGPAHCFVVVYPQGKLRLTAVPVGGFSWNAGGCCPLDNSKHVDDVGYLGNVISQAASKFQTSLEQVFVVGISNGGMMANRLACSDGRIKAMVSVAGPLVNGTLDGKLETFSCNRKVPVLHFHGMDDTVVPFDGCTESSGGMMCRMMLKFLGKKVSNVLPSVPDYIAAWKVRNGQAENQSSMVTFQNGSTQCTSSGTLASNVTLCVVANMGHAWPGHCGYLNKMVPGCKCGHDIDASDHILQFLDQYVDAAPVLV
jgi:polyhydroxybutyrate depolymerase